MRRWLLMLVLLALWFPGASAETKTFTMNNSTFGLSSTGQSNDDQTATNAPITIVISKGEGTNGANYQSGHIRFQAKNTMTISVSGDYKLISVTIATNSGYALDNASVSVGSYNTSTQVWTAPSTATTEVIITNTKTSQARLSSVEVSYESTTGGDTPAAPEAVSFSGVTPGATVTTAPTLEFTSTNATKFKYVIGEDVTTVEATSSTSDEVTATSGKGTLAASNFSAGHTYTVSVLPYNGTTAGQAASITFTVSSGSSGGDTSGSLVFDFEDNGAHRANTSNSYTGTNTYNQHGATITLNYADAVTTGSPLSGSANVLGRIAKNTTNSPTVIIGPIDLSNKTITGFSYNTKGVAAMTLVAAYSTTGDSDYTTFETLSSMPTSATTKTTSNLSITGTSTVYLKFTVSVPSSTSSNRDFQLDDITINYTTGEITDDKPGAVSISGVSNGATVTSAPTLTVSATNATIYYYTIGTDATPADPTTSSTQTSSEIASSNFAAGHTYTVKVLPYNGSVAGTVGSITFTVAYVPGAVSFIGVSNGATVTSAPTLTVSATNATVYYYTIGTDATPADPTTSSTQTSGEIASSNFAAGHTYTVKVLPYNGSVAGTVGSITFTVSSISSGIVYQRITSASEIESGANYLIVCESAGGAMGTIMSTNYRSLETAGISLSGGTATLSSTCEASIFTISGSTGAYTIYDDTYYLANSSSSYLNSVTSSSANTAKWSITFSGNNALITNAQNTTRKIYYATNYSDFNCSTSGTAVQLYKEYIQEMEATAPVLTEEYTFWPRQNDAVSERVTITVESGNTVYYTTDGTTPSNTNGTKITTSQSLTLNATTTVKAIAYAGSNTSSVVSKTYTLGQTVTGIGAFKNLASGTVARLYLPDSYNARVTYVNGTEAYVRDQTGAICIYGLTTKPALAYNKHLAGWITGTYTLNNGLPEFTVATGKTNSYDLLVADPVTEEDTNPVEIEAADYGSHLADWVTVKNLRMGANGVATVDNENITIYNKFNTGSADGYQTPYENSLVDITGIAVPQSSTQRLAPMKENGNLPLTYVIDSQEDFTSPSQAISGVRVRLGRTLYADRWQPLVLPIAVSDFSGDILSFSGVTGARTVYVENEPYTSVYLTTEEATSISAGVPYLVKPAANMVNPVFTGVTLTNTAAQTITFNGSNNAPRQGGPAKASSSGGYELVGTYSPTTVSQTDYSMHVFNSAGQIEWATTSTDVEGSTAYIETPEQSVVMLKIGDDIITGIDDLKATDGNNGPDEIYNTLGQKMNLPLRDLPSGVYIVNGIKIVK